MSTTPLAAFVALILVVVAVVVSAAAFSRMRRGELVRGSDRLGTNIAVGLALGTGAGAALAAAFGNVALGIPTGTFLASRSASRSEGATVPELASHADRRAVASFRPIPGGKT